MSKTAKQLIETPAQTQLSKSFLEYSMSVVYSRALPSIDGLKPVQRRLLHMMANVDRFLPSGGYVKSAKPVASTMGQLHPHGDSSIYQALVKLAQDFYLNIPYVDGYGNWGDATGSSAAASRYTECKLRPSALLLAGEVNEDTVEMRPNYDGTTNEPALLPIQFPALLVNGAFGIGVGFANRSAPNNPSEVMEATRYLLKNPNASLDKIMTFMPGPDFPTGGLIIGNDGIKEAYETGQGKFRIRARSSVKSLPRGKNEIIFNELPYEISTEKVIEEIKKGLKEGKFTGLADAKDLTDRKHGLRIVIETKTGIKPDVLLHELYSNTSLEITFGVNNTILVDGAPRIVGLLETIQLFLDFRRDVVRRRSQFRKDKRETRLHLVNGLLKALANIDEVIKIVRNAADSSIASASLQKKFKIDDVQASYILDIPLRRLTKFDQIELQKEKDKLEGEIAELSKILNDSKVLDALIYKELGEVQKVIARERKATIVGGTLAEHLEAAKEANANAAASLEVADEPCFVGLTAKGNFVRSMKPFTKPMRSVLSTSTRTRFIAITNLGRGFKVDTLHVGDRETKANAVLPEKLQKGEIVLAVTPMELEEGKVGGIAMGTVNGTVKIAAPQWPKTTDCFSVMSLDKGDVIINAAWVDDSNTTDLVFITSDTSILPYSATKVRPQGLSGGGMAGIKLAPNQKVTSFNVIKEADKENTIVVTATAKTIKATPYGTGLFPQKGRATGGYSAHTLLKGEEGVVLSGVSTKGVVFNPQGVAIPLPSLSTKRAGSGTKIETDGMF